MNQDQRKYLVEQVTHTYNQQVEKLKKQIPNRPSLNNYMVAAFLDNSIEFNDLKALKSKIRQRVLKMGHDDVLITEDDDNYLGSRRRNRYDDDDDEKESFIKLLAGEVFIIPLAYQKALAEYLEKKKAILEQIEILSGQYKTITMKINVGSATALESLIQQIDNLADLTLVNTQLTLGNNTKLITNGSGKPAKRIGK